MKDLFLNIFQNVSYAIYVSRLRKKTLKPYNEKSCEIIPENFISLILMFIHLNI